MLRAVGAPPEEAANGTVRISSGSAVVLGLAAWHLDVPPTTAYLMVGERCSRNCAFCAQARESQAQAGQLSRVNWPEYPLAAVLRRLAPAFDGGAIERGCLQVTAGPGPAARAESIVREIRATSAIPLCISIRVTSLQHFEGLLGLGVERVTLALDAACERVYNRVRGRDWQESLDLLWSAAQLYPWRVGTHVIVGLGETEAEVTELLQSMHDTGILTALFAFTPVAGTALAHEPPPPLARYRRIQAARHLIVSSRSRAEEFSFSATGEIESYGIGAGELRSLLAGGQAFRTSGCAGCNRPYYNERPAGPLYNYPRPLRPEEAEAATALVVDSLVGQ